WHLEYSAFRLLGSTARFPRRPRGQRRRAARRRYAAPVRLVAFAQSSPCRQIESRQGQPQQDRKGFAALLYGSLGRLTGSNLGDQQYHTHPATPQFGMRSTGLIVVPSEECCAARLMSASG